MALVGPIGANEVSSVTLGITNGNVGLYMVQFNETTDFTKSVYVRYKLVSDMAWTNAYYELEIPPGGVPDGTPVIIIPDATPGAQYEVSVINNAGGILWNTTLVTVPSAIVGDNYLVDDAIYNICGNQATFLYSLGEMATGVKMFTDILLSVPITNSLIVKQSGGDIYNVSGGIVGATTGFGCLNWRDGLFILGNTPDLCALGAVRLYTYGPPGATIQGSVLFTDRELTTRASGYTYVMETIIGLVYEIDPVTGEVGEEVGVCEDWYTVLVSVRTNKRSIRNVFGIDGFSLFNTVAIREEFAGAHIAFEGEISVVIFGGGMCDACGHNCLKLYVNDVLIETKEVQDGIYYFTSRAYLATDVIHIILYDCEAECDGESTLLIS